MQMELLDLMLGDMELADPLYRPTKFWEIGLPSLIKDLRSNGFENFRSHDSADFFHVPIYSERLKDNHYKQLDSEILPYLDTIGTKRIGNELRDIIKGHTFALHDYKLFLATDIAEKTPIPLPDLVLSSFP